MVERTPSNYIVTRKQKRYIARQNMEKKGIKNCCRHSYTTNPFSKAVNRNSSYFANHWKEYIEVE